MAVQGEPGSGAALPDQRGPGTVLERALARALDLLSQKERELAEARRTEESYRSMVEKVLDLVFCVDRQGRFTFVNSAALLMLGYRPEELIGQHFSLVFTEESRMEAGEHFHRNVQGHGPRATYELEMLSKDERRVPVEIHGTNVYENGEVVGIRGIARDISERRRTEFQQQHRFNQLSVINQIGQQMQTVLNLDELLPFIVDLVQQRLGYHCVNVFLLDDSGKAVVLRAFAGCYGEPLPLGTALTVGEEGIIGWVAKTGEPVLSNDVSRDPRYFAREELHLTCSELAVAVRMGGRIVGVLDVQSERLDAFDESDLWAVQTLAEQISTAIRNAELFDQERKRREETAIVLEITRAVSSTLLLDEVFGTAASAIARAVGIGDVGMYLVNEAGTELLPQRGADGPLMRMVLDTYLTTPLDIPSSRFLSEIAETKQPTICARADTDPRMDQEIVKAFHLKSLLAVPFVTRDELLGIAMVVTHRDYYDFSPEQVELAAGIANSVALAIENARLYERTRDLAVMEERNRLAREIHDTIAQGLTGIVLQLEAADHLMEGNPARARMRLQKATALARSSLQEARRSVWNLRPTPLEQRTLVEAVRQEVEALSEEAGIAAVLDVEQEPRGLAAEAENGLFRIAQEALNNVRKHSRASEVHVRLAAGEASVELDVRDNGVGFDSQAPRAAGQQGGFGLLGLQERVRILGGSLQIESSPGEGTLVSVRVPARR
jgi:PAS domain S-box-containing protein